MINRLILFFLFAMLILSSIPENSSAEIYLGIGPLDNLSDLKRKFPNATFTKENPAWAQDYDVMYTISGAGISGTIVINFHDAYAAWKKQFESEQDEEKKDMMKRAPSPAENSEMVSWVRWVPDTPFPVARLVKKYGKPEVSDFSQDEFKPYKEWKKRGIQAFLTDDGKNVLRIDFVFTKREREEAWQHKYGMFFPDTTGRNSNMKK